MTYSLPRAVVPDPRGNAKNAPCFRAWAFWAKRENAQVRRQAMHVGFFFPPRPISPFQRRLIRRFSASFPCLASSNHHPQCPFIFLEPGFFLAALDSFFWFCDEYHTSRPTPFPRLGYAGLTRTQGSRNLRVLRQHVQVRRCLFFT